MSGSEPGIGRLPGKYSGYSRISDEFARDGELTARARSVGLYILSHREGFTLTQRTIAKHLKMNVATVRAALGDLRDAGYMRSWTVRDDHGHVAGTRYVVDDHRHPEETWAEYLTSLNTDSDIRNADPSLSTKSQYRDSQRRKSDPPKGDHSRKGDHSGKGSLATHRELPARPPEPDGTPDALESPAVPTGCRGAPRLALDEPGTPLIDVAS